MATSMLDLEAKDLELRTPAAFVPLCNPYARYLAAHGGRGSGKSHFFAERLVEEAISINGYRAVCVREIQKSLSQSVKLLIEDKIRSMGVGNYFRIRKEFIETKRGGIIIFQGMQNHTADSIKSLEGYNRAWVEEAQTMSQYSLNLLRPTIRKPGSQLWFSWNPKNKSDPVDMFFRGKLKPPRAVVVRANYSHNPYFPDVSREDMEYDRRRDPDAFKHIWLGGYLLNSEAKVFKTINRDGFGHWRIGTREEIAEAAIRLRLFRRQGADWGYAKDPTTGVVFYIDHKNKTIYIEREVFRIGVEIDDTPALFAQIPDFEKWATTADSARPETISYMQRHGYPKFKRSNKGPNSVMEGVAFLKGYTIVVSPDCPHVADELTMYSWKVDPQTQAVLPVLEDKKNHMIDSIRYALEDDRKPKAGVVGKGNR